MAWNEHAPRRGEFDLTGRLDLGRFLDAIAAEGMHAIVRPGPYMCAEFDNGGLAGLAHPDAGHRSQGERPGLPGRRARVHRAARPGSRTPPDRRRWADRARADRERVRRIRPRLGVPADAHARHAGIGNRHPVDHDRPAYGCDAHRRRHSRAAQDGLVRIERERSSRDPATPPAHGAADVRRVLGRMGSTAGAGITTPRPPPRVRASWRSCWRPAHPSICTCSMEEPTSV